MFRFIIKGAEEKSVLSPDYENKLKFKKFFTKNRLRKSS